MENLPLVSVVIPTYNRPEFIWRACENVLNQTYKNIEIIVADDNSPSSYSEFQERIKQLDNITYVRRDANGGGAAARNTGIEHAKGTFIAFLDDDDEWVPKKLEEQVTALLKNPEIRASHCGYKYKSNEKSVIEPESIYAKEDLRKRNVLASTSGLICDAELVRAIRFDASIKRSQDWDLYLRLGDHTAFYYCRDTLYIYDDGDHHRMTNKYQEMSPEDIEYRLKMLDKHKDYLGKNNYDFHVMEYVLPALKKNKRKLPIIKLIIKKCGFFSFILGMLKKVIIKVRTR